MTTETSLTERAGAAARPAQRPSLLDSATAWLGFYAVLVLVSMLAR